MNDLAMIKIMAHELLDMLEKFDEFHPMIDKIHGMTSETSPPDEILTTICDVIEQDIKVIMAKQTSESAAERVFWPLELAISIARDVIENYRKSKRARLN